MRKATPTEQFCPSLHLPSLWQSVCMIVAVLLACSCGDDESKADTPATVFTDYTVALLLPQDQQQRWTRVAQWAQQSIEQAQSGQEQGIRLKLEWIDENDPQLADKARQLADRDDIVSIVGLTDDDHLNTVATAITMSGRKKPLIAVDVQSEELIRRFSVERFLFSLCETNATQCEMLLMEAQKNGAKTVALLAPDDTYGKTFYENFAFQAIEMGMTPQEIYYYTPQTRDASIQEALATKVDYIICTPHTTADFLKINQTYQKLVDDMSIDDYINNPPPTLLYSSESYREALSNADADLEYSEGIAIATDPSTGFRNEYQVKFSEQPLPGEAQLYDGLLLSALAVVDCTARGVDPQASEAIGNALRRLTTGVSQKTMATAWEGIGLENEIRHLQANTQTYHLLDGATGKLEMDAETATSLLHTTYMSWYLLGNTVTPVAYITSTGSHRTSSSAAGYEWRKTIEQAIDQPVTPLIYPDLRDRWAVLIAADEGWTQYRFQADVLGMYQMLKRHGMPDDHIILIMADDLADNPLNPTPGQVVNERGGENLYHDIELDYCIDSLRPADLYNIFLGVKTVHTPTVLTTGTRDNVMVYWAGHGVDGRLCWMPDRKGYSKEGITTDDLEVIVGEMLMQQRYRKMLWLVEACHAESVTEGCEGFPGVMAFAAAAKAETSKTDEWYAPGGKSGTWLCDRFSRVLTNRLNDNPDITLMQLYQQLSRGTTASHVMLNNEQNFDNLLTCHMSEFVGGK